MERMGLTERQSLLGITFMLTVILVLREIRVTLYYEEYRAPHAFSPLVDPPEKKNGSSSSSPKMASWDDDDFEQMKKYDETEDHNDISKNDATLLPEKKEARAIFTRLPDKEVKHQQPITTKRPGQSALTDVPLKSLRSKISRRAAVPSLPMPLSPPALPFAGTYMCHDVAESYGAAWIVHKEKFLQTGFGPPWTEKFSLSDMKDPGWRVGRNVTFRSINMEGASHIVLKKTKGALKTVDA